MSEMVDRVAKAIEEAAASAPIGRDIAPDIARAAIAAMRELPEEPGPRYTAGEYSRRNTEAFVKDALGEA